MKLPPIPGADDRIDFLEYHGYVAVTPYIHASDWYNVATNPFAYYIRRRLGLTHPFSVSDALSHGTWFHVAAETGANISDEPFFAKLETRLTEIKSYSSLGVSGSQIHKALEEENRRALEALVWYQESSRKRFRWYGSDYTFNELLARDKHRVLGVEMGFEITKRHGVVDLSGSRGTFDLLLLDLTDNTVHVWDWKTTGDDPLDRLRSCPFEFQTQHYLHCLDHLIKDPSFRDKHQIPDGATVGGMYHAVISKPNIKLCDKDRDFTEESKVITRGPNKGQTKTEKKYYGEPKLKNYLTRVRQWYKDQDHVPVGLSHTSWPFPDEFRYQYTKRLDLIKHYAKVTPDPMNFPSYPISGARSTGVDLLAMSQIKDWPRAIHEMNLITHHRS